MMRRLDPEALWVSATGVAGAVLFAAGFWLGKRESKPAEEPATEGPAKDPALETHVHQKLFEKLIDTTAGAVERSRSSAQFIEVAAGAVAGLYGGALALVFAVGTNPLPLRGFAPTVFLAAAIAFAAFYLAFLTRGRDTYLRETTDPVSSPKHALADATVFVAWVQEAVSRRADFLRAAVVSLAIGVALLPIPFLSVPDESVEWLPGHVPEAAAQPEPGDDPLVLPDPQFSGTEIPAEVQAIAYQARVDAYLESLNQPTPPADGAENHLALWTTIAGVIIVALTFSLSADLRAFQEWRDRRRLEQQLR